MPTFLFQSKLRRRRLLRGAGACLALPWLEAMIPARVKSADMRPVRRFVSITHGLGFFAPDFFPSRPGLDCALPSYLRPLEPLRGRFTVCSGLSHPQVGGGHNSESSLLTAAPHSGTAAYRNTQSLDQLLAQELGGETRFPSLVLSANRLSVSYTNSGAMIPPETSPSRLFAKLFVTGTAEEMRRQSERLRTGRSVLDAVAEDTRRLQRDLGAADRQRMDSWLENVRAVEMRLAAADAWTQRPKPQVEPTPPPDVTDPADLAGRERTMLGVMALALQTDSTRFITLHLQGDGSVPPIDGVNEGHHNLSHHGLDASKIAQLRLIEAAILKAFADFLQRLATREEGAATLLDHSAVLLASNLGNASNHDTTKLPVLLAGGGFRHAGHLVCARDTAAAPLPNLYLSILHRLGLERDHFVSSTGTLDGLPLL